MTVRERTHPLRVEFYNTGDAEALCSPRESVLAWREVDGGGWGRGTLRVRPRMCARALDAAPQPATIPSCVNEPYLVKQHGSVRGATLACA